MNRHTDLIFDGGYLYARSFYAAFANPELKKAKDANGNSAGAISACLKTVLSLLNEDSRHIPDSPTRMLFCWDGDAKKDKGRGEKPPEFYEQQERVPKVLRKLFSAKNAFPEFEADDAVATAAYRSAALGNKVYVISGDKDLKQLEGGGIHYYSLSEKRLLTRSEICVNKHWSVKRPIQIALALALLGDKGDNINGVPKFGTVKVKKAFENVTEDMNFDQALAVIEKQVPNEHKDSFWESLDLTLLNDKIPDVPEPSPISLADLDYFNSLGLDYIRNDYRRIYCQRNDIDIEDAILG